jgi:hypothetical protein
MSGEDILLVESMLPILGAPVLGGLLGWVIGFLLHKPRWAVLGGILGGTVGGWAGVGWHRGWSWVIDMYSGPHPLLADWLYMVVGALVGTLVLTLVVSRRNPRQ